MNYQDFSLGNYKFRTGYPTDKYDKLILTNLCLWFWNGYYWELARQYLENRDQARDYAMVYCKI